MQCANASLLTTVGFVVLIEISEGGLHTRLCKLRVLSVSAQKNAARRSLYRDISGADEHAMQLSSATRSLSAAATRSSRSYAYCRGIYTARTRPTKLPSAITATRTSTLLFTSLLPVAFVSNQQHSHLSSSSQAMSESKSTAKSFYDLKAELPNGSIFNFEDLKGKVVLIVNVASKWCAGWNITS